MNLDDLYQRTLFGQMIQRGIDEFSMRFDEGPRRHLGASMIGHQCDRFLWFSFRHAFRNNWIPRMLRLFQRGHREETWLWAMLRADGWIVHDVDPTTGKQWRVDAVEGHFSGSLDAIGYPPPKYGVFEWLLLECKTNKSGENGKKWDELSKYKLEIAKPMHWSQANVYGFMKGLLHGVYFNTNKDDDRMHIEPFAIVPDVAHRSIQKAEFVILASIAPPKLHQNSAHFDCKYCDAQDICHHGAALLVNCRSCRYSMPVQNRGWYCNKYLQPLTDELIKTGCTNWSELIH